MEARKRHLSRSILVLAAVAALFVFSHPGWAAPNTLSAQPWEKFGANVGVFLSETDSNLRFGTGIGLDIDVEELLDMDATNTVLQAGALWRFSDNRRHRLDLTWLSFKRDAKKNVLQDFVIENKNGDLVTIEAGSEVKSTFDLDIYELAYSYSFIQDDRIDLSLGLGLYVMPIDFEIRSTGVFAAEGSQSFTAPLPALGLRMDVVLSPGWYIRSKSQAFYVEYDSFTGSLLEFQTALEYNPWQHLGIGLGFDILALKMESEDEDWPGIDLKGNVEFGYTGLQVYVHWFF